MTAFEVRASGPQIETSGRDGALRVLLIGSGITTGWGAPTHSLALMGAVRRALQVRLGRDVDIEQLSTMGATMDRGLQILGSRATEHWDLVVIAFGLSDAMQLTSPAAWAQALRRLLAAFDPGLPTDVIVPILVVGIPPTESLGALRALLPFRRTIARHATRLNAVTAQVTARTPRATFVAMPGMANNIQRPAGSPEAYNRWAGAIADHTPKRVGQASHRASTSAVDPRLIREAAAVLERLAEQPATSRRKPDEPAQEVSPPRSLVARS